MDVEGDEPFVLQWGAETLARTESLVLEYAPDDWRKAGSEPAALFELLAPHFAHVVRFDGATVVETTVAECLRSELKTELAFRR